MKFLLVERYITLIAPDQKEKYKDVVWDILQKSYKDIGGFWTHKNPEELIQLTSVWKLAKKNGEIVAAAVYRDKFGRKCVGLGSNGTFIGIEALMGIMAEDQNPKLRRAWIEISPRLERMWKKIGGNRLNTNVIKALMRSADISPVDEYRYERHIAGVEPQVKSAWGWPQLSMESTKFKVLTNPSYDWKKRRKPKAPKVQKSIPDSDLAMQKGKSYRQTVKAQDEYHYKGKPYGADKPHV
jgi:hypothetical protein